MTLVEQLNKVKAVKAAKQLEIKNLLTKAIEVVSEEVNVGDSTEANTQDERTIPIDVDQTEEVVDSASDIVEVKKSKSVSLSIKTNKTQYKKVSLK